MSSKCLMFAIMVNITPIVINKKFQVSSLNITLIISWYFLILKAASHLSTNKPRLWWIQVLRCFSLHIITTRRRVRQNINFSPFFQFQMGLPTSHCDKRLLVVNLKVLVHWSHKGATSYLRQTHKLDKLCIRLHKPKPFLFMCSNFRVKTLVGDIG